MGYDGAPGTPSRKTLHVEILRSQPADSSRSLRRPRARACLGPDAARHRLRRRAAPRPLYGGVELAAAGAGARRRSARRGGCGRPLSQGRCRVATGAAGLLDANADDAGRHPVRRALARGEGERAGLPHLDSRPRERRAVPHLRSPVQQRHLLLDRVHAAPGFRHGRRVSRVSGAPPRRAALLRRADRQHAGRPRARLHGAARVGRRARPDDRAVREGGHDQSAVRAVHADARDHPRCRAGGDARRSGDGDPRRRCAGVRASPRLHAHRVPAQGADDARGDRDARRRGLLPGHDREVHHAEPDGQADPRDRPEGGRTDRGGDGSHQGAGGLQRDDGRVLPLPADRSAVLRQDTARAPVVLGLRLEEGRLEARARRSDSCRGAGMASVPFPRRSRRSTPAAAAASRRA